MNAEQKGLLDEAVRRCRYQLGQGFTDRDEALTRAVVQAVLDILAIPPTSPPPGPSEED